MIPAGYTRWVAALILGGFAGGWLLSRWPLQRALFVFGIAQALPCLALWALSRSSAGLGWMLAAVATENLGNGLGMVALTAGYAAKEMGWGPFFPTGLGLAIPGFLMLWQWDRWGPTEERSD